MLEVVLGRGIIGEMTEPIALVTSPMALVSPPMIPPAPVSGVELVVAAAVAVDVPVAAVAVVLSLHAK